MADKKKKGDKGKDESEKRMAPLKRVLGMSGIPTDGMTRVEMHKLPSPLSDKDHEELIANGMELFFTEPFPYADRDYCLRDAPNFHKHEAALRKLLEPYLRHNLEDEVLGLVKMGQSYLWGTAITTGADIEEATRDRYAAGEALMAYAKKHWKAMWKGTNRPMPDEGNIEVNFESQAQEVMLYQVYPKFKVPEAVKESMITNAVVAAERVKIDGVRLIDSKFYKDEANQQLMRGVLADRAEYELAMAGIRRPAVQPMSAMLDMGGPSKGTHAEQAKWSRAMRASMRNHRGIEDDERPEIEDLYAKLEEYIGTEQTTKDGPKIMNAFRKSIDKQLQRFIKANHLDLPYHHRGQAPELS